VVQEFGALELARQRVARLRVRRIGRHGRTS
jgi:hypothetical protein